MGWVLLQVAAGGAFGAVGRFMTGMLAARLLGSGFPFGTLVVNAAGCLAMGFVFAALAGGKAGSAEPAPFIMTGFLGGYTTMSAYALDAWNLLNSGKAGEAVFYAAGSLVIAFAALAAGMGLGRWAAG